MCFARAVVSGPGAQPDLEASEEVLTWMWMLRGEEGVGVSEDRPRES